MASFIYCRVCFFACAASDDGDGDACFTCGGQSGVQATKSLRERGFGSIIMGLTGNTLEEELVEFENAGAG